ncbi:DUF4256 domain-containing protein [Patescibacteria group bacterium]
MSKRSEISDLRDEERRIKKILEPLRESNETWELDETYMDPAERRRIKQSRYEQRLSEVRREREKREERRNEESKNTNLVSPGDYNGVDMRPHFDSDEDQLNYDAKGLIEITKRIVGNVEVTTDQVMLVLQRKDDDPQQLRIAVDKILSEKFVPTLGVDKVIADHSHFEETLPPEIADELIDSVVKKFIVNSKKYYNKEIYLLNPTLAKAYYGIIFHYPGEAKKFPRGRYPYPGISLDKITDRLTWAKENAPKKLWSLFLMKETGGEPDIASYDDETQQLEFMDCSCETPSGRTNVCYDEYGENLARESGKSPNGNAVCLAEKMGVELITEEDVIRYRYFGGRYDFNNTYSYIHSPNIIDAPDPDRKGKPLHSFWKRPWAEGENNEKEDYGYMSVNTMERATCWPVLGFRAKLLI